jgi:hypothetical protein
MCGKIAICRTTGKVTARTPVGAYFGIDRGSYQSPFSFLVLRSTRLVFLTLFRRELV